MIFVASLVYHCLMSLGFLDTLADCHADDGEPHMHSTFHVEGIPLDMGNRYLRYVRIQGACFLGFPLLI